MGKGDEIKLYTIEISVMVQPERCTGIARYTTAQRARGVMKGMMR